MPRTWEGITEQQGGHGSTKEFQPLLYLYQSPTYLPLCKGLGNEHGELESWVHLQGCQLLGTMAMCWGDSWDWSGGMARAGVGVEEGSPSVSVTSWSEWTSAQGWMRSCPRDDKSGLREDRTGDFIVGVCSRPPYQMTEWMSCTMDRKEQPCDHKPWFSWGTSTTCHTYQNHRQLLQSHCLKSLCLAVTLQNSSQAALHSHFI